MHDERPLRARIAAALAIIYFVWGTSYIATKVMVTDQPPLFAAGLRFTLAGILLTAFSSLRYGRPNLARVELRHILVMAFLAVLFSNACHVIAMQHVQSNTAALLNATPALWIAWLGTFGPRRRPLSVAQKAGLFAGLAGVPIWVGFIAKLQVLKAAIDAGKQAFEEKKLDEAEKQFALAVKHAETFGGNDPRLAAALDHLLATMACHSVVRAGDLLSPEAARGGPIALLRDETPVLGAVNCFLLDELFTGADANGAWLNGRAIQVSEIDDPARGILQTGVPARADAASFAQFEARLRTWRKVRMIGSAATALAYVAAGRAEAYRESGAMIWDVAGGCALVRAAGGRAEYSGPALDGPLEVVAHTACIPAPH